MQLILWRHAEAEIGEQDLARALTVKGRKQAQKIAAELHKRLPEHYDLWVSEAVRSQQTAAFLQHDWQVQAAFNPDEDVQPMLAKLNAARLAGVQTLVLLGHQPWIGDLCAYLLNQNWNATAYWSVKKGAFWWFDCQGELGVAPVKLRLMLAPAEI